MNKNYYMAISINGVVQFKIGFKTEKERDAAVEFNINYSNYTLMAQSKYDNVVKLLFI